MTSWCVAPDFGTPVYYDYGTNIYYEGDDVVYNDEVIATADEYAAQAQDIATGIPDDIDPADVQWLPLGVFALSSDPESTEDATLFLQLAISKEGLIAGTVQNTSTEDSFEVEGTVDRDSQRAAWGPVGESWPIMETSLFSLTESEASALIHFKDGQTQQWTMVRMDNPEKK